MNTRTRVSLTAGLAVVLGLSLWLGGEGLSPSRDLMEALRSTPIRVFSVAIVVLVTMAVGRWWVVAAMAGPFGALLVLQLTGHMSHELDGSAPPLNVVAIFGLVYVGVLLLILVAVRKLLDLCLRRVADVRRSRRATVGP